MDDAAAAAARGPPLHGHSSLSQLPSRKEWRAISEHPFRNNGGEEPGRAKLVQSEERTIHEVQEGVEALDLNFCSINVDGGGGGMSEDGLQQRLHEVTRQREELMHVEVDLRAQAIIRAEILVMQNSYKDQLRQHANAASNLKEQLQEREQHIHELELKMEEKDQELRALNNEAAWAKEDFLREQNEKLSTFRRERDNSEVEKAHHLKQIHDLQERNKENDGRFLALEEQLRAAQEAILFKDEQLREAQAWVARFQEMCAMNQALQAELRELQHYYMVLQRQFMDMERHHLQAIHQLQLELTEARGRNGVFPDAQQTTQVAELSFQVQDSEIQNSGNDVAQSNGNSAFVSDGKLDALPSSVTSSGGSTEAEDVPCIPLVPSIVEVGAFYHPGQMNTLPLVPSVVTPPVLSTFSSHPERSQQVQAPTPAQHWSNQQVVSDASQMLNQAEHQISQAGHDLLGVEDSAESQMVQKSQLGIHYNEKHTATLINGSSEVNHEKPENILAQEQTLKSTALFSAQNNGLSSNNVAKVNGSVPTSEISTMSEHSNSSIAVKPMEPSLLDERSLLACIVRSIPAGSGGGIRISSTLPNRLGKMLAPLHWHDYKKKYGKLDDFVAQHPELFVIEGDFILLCDGAQEIISVTTAVAKVAAASAGSSSLFPSVAITPVAQANRLKKSSAESESNLRSIESAMGANRGDSFNKLHGQQGGGADSLHGLADIKPLSGPTNHRNPNTPSETMLSVHLENSNGGNHSGTSSGFSQSKGLSNGRGSFGRRRSSGAGAVTRR